jgi:competence protein ComEC
MLRWVPYAMVRVVIFFIAGILVGIFAFDCIAELTVQIIFAAVILLYYVSYLLLRNNQWLSPLTGCLGLSAIFLAGYLTVLQKTDSRNSSHLLHRPEPVDYYLAKVTDQPEERARSFRVAIEALQIESMGQWIPASGKILLYLSKSTGSPDVKYGDIILVRGSPIRVPPPANPGEFNFRDFLRFKNTFHQHFVKTDQVRTVVRSHDHGILDYSHRARVWASDQLKKFIPGKQELGITMALVLGVTEGLDNDLLDAYSASGAMHVLSVSGLHVGIIYALILFFLKPIRAFSWSRWLIAAFSLICLWGYAFVTGLSPSVLRAVMMFSFIVVATPFGRGTNIYNSLAASAFLLLIYDPYLIMSVGFQLSYLAVIGIVFLYRPLYNLWELENIWWDKVWQITCVSLVAQLATFALGIFYFHQFPVYFLLSNLLVVPLSTAVLVVGLVLLVFCSIPALASLVAIVLEFLVRLLNGSVFLIEDMPFSVIRNIQISSMQCLLLMVTIVSMILLFKARKFQFVLFTLGCTVLFCGLQWWIFTTEVNCSKLVVYAIPGHCAVEWLHLGQSVFYADSGFLRDERQIRFHIEPNRILSKTGKTHSLPMERIDTRKGLSMFIWHGKTIVWMNAPKVSLPDHLVADYLIIGHNSEIALADIAHKIEFKQLILDGSNSFTYSRRVMKEAEQLNLTAHFVMEQGAFVINL